MKKRGTSIQTKPIKNGLTLVQNLLGSVLVVSGLVSCANPITPGSNGSSADLTAEQSYESTLTQTKVSFDYNDFFTLTQPNANNCAGDARNFYDAILTTPTTNTPLILGTSIENTSATIRPLFVKNISVDVTDSNSNIPGNLALGCSYGTGSTAPAATNCATFDYAANAGINTNLAGSILMIGGLENSQAQEVSCDTVTGFYSNVCPTSVYALSVDSLAASAATNPPSTLAPGLESATTPISSWGNLASSTTYAGPTGLAGATAVYDSADANVMIFGGDATLTSTGTNIQSAASDTTWNFSLKNQSWTSTASNPSVNLLLKETLEEDANGDRYLPNVPTARANFGYAAVPGMSLNVMSTNGTVASGNIDTTDRIIIAGGQDSTGYVSDSYKFNPTFAPEYFDAENRSTGAPAAGELTQWLGSYETQVLYNSETPALEAPNPKLQFPFPTGGVSPSPIPGTSFGMAPVYNSSSGAGYAIALGGFNTSISVAQSNNGCNTSADGGQCAMMISTRSGSETDTANFSAAGNSLVPEATLSGYTSMTPITWSAFTSASQTGVYLYGGASLLQGFSLAQNDLVYFGGSTCGNYLVAGQTSCDFANPGAYYRLGATPASSLTVPTTTAMSGTIPTRAGMASARGADASGNVMMVAFGGMRGVDLADDTSIYYMYSNGGTPTWVKTTATNGGPVPLTNSSMVYSHITQKFYLFGGYNTSNVAVADTWELTVGGNSCAATGNCTFTWTQLNVTNGLACFPNCPAARRSHRMVEVNYSHTNPTVEPTCTGTSPCSFGIFMEGGTTDGTTPLGDRWMFDPTANEGFGLWQEMKEMPARTLSAAASVDYSIQENTNTAHRAVLFGGQTGLQNPLNVANVGTQVAPTLGDTWIYDYDANTWNRVALLGQGYNGTPVVGSELSNRQAYNATDATALGRKRAELSPPPTSGAMMVTRTLSGPGRAGSAALTIPEVFLIGGRKKDGSYQTFDHVYKFCIGSTGEAYSGGDGASTFATPSLTNSQCDAYDPVANPFSPNPITAQGGYTGRWLRKIPTSAVGTAAATALSSYLGAASYDAVDDRILVYGGYQLTAGGTFVTDTNHQTISSSVFEYTPPPSQTVDGTWQEAPVCSGSAVPTPRYGHTIAYDTKTHQVVIVGGYSSIGAALTQTNSSIDGNYTTPEVWGGTRNPTGSGSGGPCYTWVQKTTFGNQLGVASTLPPEYGIGFTAATYIPSEGYSSGYYSMFNSSCTGAGPVSSPASNSSLYAGGVYFDIDRTQLGPYENLILNVTFIPLAQGNQSPGATPMTSSDNALFEVHLVSTGQTQAALEAVSQPRYLTYFPETDGTATYPEVVPALAILAPPDGQIRQEQLLIPLGVSTSIDRIRIERHSGSGILIDASLFRMGQASTSTTAQ